MLNPDDDNNRYLNQLIGGFNILNNSPEYLQDLADTSELLYVFSRLSKRIAENAEDQRHDEDYRQEICEGDEALLKIVTDKLRLQCKNYMQAHTDYNKGEYRKFEYIASLLNAYDSAEKELGKIADEPDLSGLTGQIKEAVEEYNKIQGDLPGKMDTFREYSKSSLILEDLPTTLQTLYKDDISPEYVLTQKDPSEILDNEIINLEDEIRQRTEDCDNTKAEAENAFTNGKESILAHQEKELNQVDEELQNAADDLEKRLKEAQKGIEEKIPTNMVQDDINNAMAYSDERFDAVSPEYRNAGGPLNPGENDRLAWTRGEIKNPEEYFTRMADIAFDNGKKLDSEAELLEKGLRQIENELANQEEMLSSKYSGYFKLQQGVTDFLVNNIGVDVQSPEYRKNYIEVLKNYADNDPALSSQVKSIVTFDEEYQALQDELDELAVTSLGKLGIKDMKKYGVNVPDPEAPEEVKINKEELTKMNAPLQGKVFGQSTYGKTFFKCIDDLAANIGKIEKNGNFAFSDSVKKQYAELAAAVKSLKGLTGIRKSEDAVNLNTVFNNYSVLLNAGKELGASSDKELGAAGSQLSALKERFNKLLEDPGFAAVRKGMNFFKAQADKVAEAELATRNAIAGKSDELVNKMADNRKYAEEVYGKLLEYPKATRINFEKLNKSIEANQKSAVEFKSRIAQNKLDREYIKVSREYIISQLQIKRFNVKATAEKEKLRVVQEDYNKLKDTAFNRKQDIKDNWSIKQAGLEDEYNEKIASINKERAKIKGLSEKLGRLKNFAAVTKEIFKAKKELTDQSKTVGKLHKQFSNAQEKIKNGIREQRSLMIENINKEVTDTINNMHKTSKLWFDSKEYTEMMHALDAYQQGPRNPENKTAFAESITDVKRSLQTYIDKKNLDGKTVRSTDSGQKRLSGAYTVLRLFDQMEKRLEAYDAELARVDQMAVSSPTLTSEEAAIIGTESSSMKYKLTEVEHVPQKPVAITERLKTHFKPLIEKARSVSESLGNIFEEGIVGLTQKKESAFLRGAAAVAVASSLEGKDLQGIGSEALSNLVDMYSKTIAVKEFSIHLQNGNAGLEDAQKLLSGSDFVKNINSEITQMQKTNAKNNTVVKGEAVIKEDGPKKDTFVAAQ